MRPLFEMIAIFPSAGSWLDPLMMAALKSTALIALAGLAVTLLRRAPAATRHLVWTLALLGALGIPLASGVLPAWPVRWLPTLALPALKSEPAVPAQAPVPPTHLDVARPGNTSLLTKAEPGVQSSASPSTASEQEVAAHPARGAVVGGASRAQAEQHPSPPASSGLARVDWVRAIPALWLLGVLLVLGRRMLASWWLGRMSRRAVAVTDPAWLTAAARHASELGIARGISLRITSEVSVPMTFGTLAPTVLLPAGASGWSARRRSIVLLHELAHVRRLDTLTLLLAHIALACYWFNPFVWIAVRSLRAEAERACDDQVLRAGLRPSAYAGDLLEIARTAGADDRLASAALAMARRSQLEGRLLAILDPRQPRGSAGRLSLAVAVLVAVAGIGVLAAVEPAQSRLAPLPGRPAATSARSTRIARPETPAPVAIVTSAAAGPGAPVTVTTVTTNGGSVDVMVAPATPAPPESEPTPAPAAALSPAPFTFEWDSSPTPAVAPRAEPGASPVAAAAPVAEAASSSHEHSGSTSNSTWSITEDDGKPRSWNGFWNGPSFNARYKGQGIIKFNRDFTDVETLSPDGYLTIEENRNGQKRRAEFRSRAGGVERRFWVNGKASPWDAEARAWLAGFLVETDRRSGVFVNERFPRLMKEGGADRVLQEIGLMTSDYGKGVYFKRLLDSPLDAATLRRAVTQAGREIKSDYELAQALSHAVGKNALANEATRRAFLLALEGIQSDYEHSRVLMMLLERNDLSADEANGALQSASTLKSDYERGRVLVKLAERGRVPSSTQREYLRAASSMKSDYEKGRVLKALVDQAGVEGENVLALLAATATFQSDYERANVLVQVADRIPLDATSRAAFRASADGLHSSYERQRALAALGESTTR